jgi:hypothetical protein
MNRCLLPLPPQRRAIVRALSCLSALLLAAPLVQSQTSVRPFPASALRGTLEVKAPPEVLMDGAPARLSPGSRIRGANNMLVMSGQIVGKSLTVNYTRDAQGAIHDVWLLTPAEVAEKRPVAGTRPIPLLMGDAATKP